MVGHPDRRKPGMGKLVDDRLVGLVKWNGTSGGRERLEWIEILVLHLHSDLCATPSDDLDVVTPIRRQIGQCENLFGRLDELETFVLGSHLAMPEPHIAAAGVDLTGEIEARFARQHAENAASQSRMFGVICCRNAGFIEIDIEMNARPAGALADFNAWNRLGVLLDSLQFVVGHTDALRVPDNGIVVKPQGAASAGLPIPARPANGFDVQIEWPAKLVVVELRCDGGVLRDSDVEPFVFAIGVGVAPPIDRLAVVGGHVDLQFHRARMAKNAVQQVGTIMNGAASTDEIVDGFRDFRHVILQWLFLLHVRMYQIPKNSHGLFNYCRSPATWGRL